MNRFSSILSKVSYTRSLFAVEIIRKNTHTFNVESVCVALLKLLLGAILGVATLISAIIIAPFWLILWVWRKLDQKPPVL